MNVDDKVRFLDSVGGGIHFSHCGEIPDGVLHLLAVVFPESNVQLLINTNPSPQRIPMSEARDSRI